MTINLKKYTPTHVYGSYAEVDEFISFAKSDLSPVTWNELWEPFHDMFAQMHSDRVTIEFQNNITTDVVYVTYMRHGIIIGYRLSTESYPGKRMPYLNKNKLLTFA